MKPQTSPMREGGQARPGRWEVGLKILLNTPFCWLQLATDTFIFLEEPLKLVIGNHAHLAHPSFLSLRKNNLEYRISFKNFSFIFKGTQFKRILSSSRSHVTVFVILFCSQNWGGFMEMIIVSSMCLFTRKKYGGKSNELRPHKIKLDLKLGNKVNLNMNKISNNYSLL